MGKIDLAELYKKNYTNAEDEWVSEVVRENFESV